MSKEKTLNFEQELKKCKSIDDLMGKNGLFQRMIGSTLERILEAEMEDHLGYEKHASQGHLSGNSRNGKNSKTLQSSYGPIDLEVPRDRNGDFTPQVVKKYQRKINDFDDKIISMYARGMSTRDIQDHVKEIYGAEISPMQISQITDKVFDLVHEWRNRPLNKIYPITYFDAIHYRVRENGRVITKAAYTCLGIDLEGKKEVLGIWIGEHEGAKFWLSVFTELKNRGVQDIFIACIDGLKGLPDAIHAIFPQAEIQLCVIHMIRNSLKYIPHKYGKVFMKDLKTVYRAVGEKEGLGNLKLLQDHWENRYPLAVRPWVKHWDNVKTFFQFPEEIRRIIYTTNAVESLHRQFRKVTKSRSAFPNDRSLEKLLFLTIRNISRKWTMPLLNWKNALSQFAILYEGRI